MESISKLWRFTNNRRIPLRYEAIPVRDSARTVGKTGRFNQKILSKLDMYSGLKKSPPISEVYFSTYNYEDKLSSTAHNLTSIKSISLYKVVTSNRDMKKYN